MIRLLLLAALAAYLDHPIIATLLLVPVAFHVGHRHAIRRSGTTMIRTGTRRVFTGRL
jgi:hypothetical protein